MKPIDLQTLQILIEKNFTLEQLKSLCSTLSISAEQAPGKGLITKAHAIIYYMANQGRIRELFDGLKKLKPEVFSEFSLAETDRRPQIPHLNTDPTLIDVPLDQVGSRVIQLDTNDPRANLLIEQVQKLLDRLERLTDANFQKKAYETLEEATRLLRSNPAKVEDWQVQMIRAEFMIRTTNAEIYRAEIAIERKRVQVAYENEYLSEIAQDERKLSWLIPAIILLYVCLVICMAIFVPLYKGIDYIIPVLGIPLPILIWSAIGSLCSLLFRYYKRERTSAFIPEIKLTIGRFWIGIVGGIIFYFAVRSGLFELSNQVVDLNKASSGQQQVLWALVWLISFSDFLFERVIARISGNIVGEENGEKALASVLKVTSSEIANIMRDSNEQLIAMRKVISELEETKLSNTIGTVISKANTPVHNSNKVIETNADSISQPLVQTTPILSENDDVEDSKNSI